MACFKKCKPAMHCRLHTALGLAAVLLSLETTASTCSSADLPVFTDPASAGTDFHVQGEYAGKVGAEFPIGIQVIALGNHQFQGVLYAGGLPGAGWNQSTVFHVKGKTHDGRTAFQGVHGERLMFANSNFNGSIREDVFTGEAHMFRGRLHNVKFRLTKVHRKLPTRWSRAMVTSRGARRSRIASTARRNFSTRVGGLPPDSSGKHAGT